MTEPPERDDYDLIVLGAGPGGMCAALVAALEGLRPLLVEKSGQVGGTAATSAGSIWIPGNTASRTAGYEDSIEAAATYLDALIGAPDETGLRRAYLETGPEAVDYLDARSDVRFVPAGEHPDYRDMPGSAVAGRALLARPFDGRLLGRDFERVRPPIPEFMVLGGMMVSKADLPHLVDRYRSLGSFLHAARLVLRYGADRLRYRRGTRLVMGNALVARFLCSLLKQGVPIWYGSTARELIRENGRIAGAVIESPDGVRHVRAERGVVTATGGLGHDPAMRRDFMPTPTPPHSMASEFDTGDGLALGLANGGTMASERTRPGGFWTPVSITRRADGSKGLYPHILLDRAKPGLIAVNATGRRFVNEAASYHDFVQGMYAANARLNRISAHLICTAGFVRTYGLGNIPPGTTRLERYVRDGYIAIAPTIEKLAQRIGVDAPALRETVERYNAMARNGRDEDFGKGETAVNRFNGDPAVTPNACLAPLETGPFVAVEVWPADLGTATGLTTDADARVLDEDGRPIPGLYAVGNDMSSVMAGTYPGPGTTIGPAIVFGYRAALQAAGRPEGPSREGQDIHHADGP